MIDPGLNFFGNSVDAGMRLDELSAYSEHLDAFLAEMEGRLNGSSDLDDEYLFSEPFPNILHSSLIISVVAFIEAELKGYCEVVQETEGLKLAMADLTGSPIRQFRLYIEEVVGFSLGLNQELWQDVTEIFALRHHFAHGLDARGVAPSGTVRSLQERSKAFHIEEGRVYVSRRTSLFVIDRAKKFLDFIYDAALDRYPRKD